MAKARQPDSITHTEERRAKMQAESDGQTVEREEAEAERKDKQADRERKSKEEETRFLAGQVSLIQEGETRDQLLERIKAMRDDVPAGPPEPPPLTEHMRKQLAAEQEAGRAAVKRAEEELERNREARRKAEAEAIKREGTMEAVHHPNPGMGEQFPTQGPAMGKKK